MQERSQRRTTGQEHHQAGPVTGSRGESRRRWLQSAEGEQVRRRLEERTSDTGLVQHLLHQAAWKAASTPHGRTLAEVPDTLAEDVWDTHQALDAHAESSE